MVEGEPSALRCQARPRAARAGYRDDMLCASLANTLVTFRGLSVPVCRIHERMFRGWAEDAERNADLHWAWGPWSAAVTLATAAKLAQDLL
jgi:hypothetical protein